MWTEITNICRFRSQLLECREFESVDQHEVKGYI